MDDGSLDLHVVLLGILKSGAVYIPFDADAPPERIGECLTDCEARLVIIDAITSEKLDRPLPGLLPIVMKGEAIPAHTHWAGAPARPAGH
ncbi:hypothetical protein HMPREF9946_04877 [Acetobacteraceae bacterium AT-5844]|nr:hypothetical protein HMPREF9946_04877 [Acetobacteraceae bacterium AT-5844]